MTLEQIVWWNGFEKGFGAGALLAWGLALVCFMALRRDVQLYIDWKKKK